MNEANMPKFNIRAEIDEKSFYEVLKDKEIPLELSLEHFEWEIDHSYEDGDDTVFVIKATAFKMPQSQCMSKGSLSKSRLSDEELRQALGQSPLGSLSDLCAEQSHTDCYRCPILEIQPSPFPDGTPLLRKE